MVNDSWRGSYSSQPTQVYKHFLSVHVTYSYVALSWVCSLRRNNKEPGKRALSQPCFWQGHKQNCWRVVLVLPDKLLSPPCIVRRLLLRAVSCVMTVLESTLGFSSGLEIYFKEKQIENVAGLNRGRASEQQLSKELIFFSKLHTVVLLN